MLHCKVENGVIRSEDKLVFETSKMRVEGETTINLASEDLDMTLLPGPKAALAWA